MAHEQAEHTPRASKASPHTGLPGFARRAATKLRQAPTRAARAVRWALLAECVAILLWALWVGRDYLNLDPQMWPTGRELSSSLPTHYLWTLFQRCGACALWSGVLQGGAPAFAELHGAPLHPLVIVTTLLWGVVNGAKIALVGALAMAGLGQWWLARALRLGRVARLWSAGLAVAGGHLAARMENGTFALVLSAAACSLVLAPGLELALNGKRRSAVLLGVTLALALVSGQGYMQVGLVLAILPAFLVLLVNGRLRVRPAWKGFALAAVLAIALAGVFWVPMAHFWPNFAKGVNFDLKGVQPLEYQPLNLVIRDPGFLSNGSLGKLPYPYTSGNYVGWVPVLLAVLAIRFVPRERLPVLAFLVVSIVLAYLVSSAAILRLILRLAPTVVGGVRYPALSASLAVPPLLALAAIGLDGLLKLNWPRLTIGLTRLPDSGLSRSVTLSLIVLAVPLIGSLKSAHDFSRLWLRTQSVGADIPAVLAAVRTDTTQWVSLGWGEHYWITPAAEAGIKLSDGVRPWEWKDRARPPAYIQGTREPVDSASPEFIGQVKGVNLVRHPENEYALVDTGTEPVACRAIAVGGNIDVTCDADAAGTLIVRENQWSGWKATRDGTPVSLRPGPWLSVPAPAGRHVYTFRYRPWDVPLGLALTILGTLWAIWLWLRKPSGVGAGVEPELGG